MRTIAAGAVALFLAGCAGLPVVEIDASASKNLTPWRKSGYDDRGPFRIESGNTVGSATVRVFFCRPEPAPLAVRAFAVADHDSKLLTNRGDEYAAQNLLGIGARGTINRCR